MHRLGLRVNKYVDQSTSMSNFHGVLLGVCFLDLGPVESTQLAIAIGFYTGTHKLNN